MRRVPRRISRPDKESEVANILLTFFFLERCFDRFSSDGIDDALFQTRKSGRKWQIRRPRSRQIDQQLLLNGALIRTQNKNPISQKYCFINVMRHENNRLFFLLPDTKKELLHLRACLHIEGSEWFVE